MTLIYNQLCQYKGVWHLVSWDTEQRRGSLIVGKAMPRVGDYVSADNYHDGIAIDSCQDITFFPEVYYRGVQVFPQHWHPESSEPLVACHMPLNVRPGETAEQSRARRQTLLDEGWTYSAWEGLARYVHVDELQKIEGPPPEGAF